MKRKTLINIVALICASLAWIYTLSVTSVVDTTGANFGLAQLLPVTFWLGLVACVVSLAVSLLDIEHTSLALLVISLVFLLFYVQWTASLVEENPRFIDSYLHMGSVMNIVATGHSGQSMLNYPNFPGAFIFFAILISVSGISPFFIIKFYQPFFVAFFSVLLFIIALKFTGSRRYALLSPILFFSFAWFDEFHLSPQSFALVLFAFAVYSMFKISAFGMWKTSVLTLLTGFSIIIVHPETSLFLLFFLAAVVLFSRRNMNVNALKSRLNGFNMLMLLLVLVTAWGIFQATTTFKEFVQRIITPHSVETLLRIFTSHQSSATPLSQTQTIINNLRIAQSMAFWSIGLGLVLMYYIIRAIKSKHNDSSILIICWLVSSFAFGIIVVLGAFGFWERVAIFSLIPISVFYAFSASRRTIPRIWNATILALILVSVIVLPVTIYGNESYEYVSSTDLSAEQRVIGSLRNATLADYWALVKYYPELQTKNIRVIDIGSETALSADAVIFSVIATNIYETRYNMTTMQAIMSGLKMDHVWNKAYDNGQTVAYYQKPRNPRG